MNVLRLDKNKDKYFQIKQKFFKDARIIIIFFIVRYLLTNISIFLTLIFIFFFNRNPMEIHYIESLIEKCMSFTHSKHKISY